jgi:hypothetical protein
MSIAHGTHIKTKTVIGNGFIISLIHLLLFSQMVRLMIVKEVIIISIGPFIRMLKPNDTHRTQHERFVPFCLNEISEPKLSADKPTKNASVFAM